MTADDTSRDALIERVARTWYDSQGFHAADSWDAETRLNREANYLPHAEAVVDAVVMPLVEERERLTQAMWDAYGILGFDTGGDPTPDAWIAGAKILDVWIEQWLRYVREARKDYDDLCDESDPHEAAEFARLTRERDAAIKRAEAAEAAHEKLTEAVLYYAASYEDFPNKTVTERLIAPTLRQVGKDLRHILDEHGVGR